MAFVSEREWLDQGIEHTAGLEMNCLRVQLYAADRQQRAKLVERLGLPALTTISCIIFTVKTLQT